MKSTQDKNVYYFVDESGDPVFYDSRGNLIVGENGVSKVLLLGFISCYDPHVLRVKLDELRKKLVSDPYLKGIPSMEKTALSFHAKDDCPEVRREVYSLLATLDFTAEMFVARKKERIFNKTHKGKESVFYDDMISKLFENKLHLHSSNTIIFAVRGNSVRQAPLSLALEKAKSTFSKKWDSEVDTSISIQAQTPTGEPCLQIIDYVNWSIYRAFVRGEDRYFKSIESKVKLIADIYDSANYPKVYYSKKNPFDVSKISPL